MTLKVLGSSSAGNCYILDSGSEALVLEVGVKFDKVLKAVGYKLEKIAGCVVTHRHGDHAGHIAEVVRFGIHTLALPDVWEAKGIDVPESVHLTLGRAYAFGGFRVFPFPAYHDVPCVGYMVQHPNMGRLMFLTDSYMCDARFTGLNHMLIECNYSYERLQKSIDDGATHPAQAFRLRESHLELNTCKDILRTTDLTSVSEIVLIHLSSANSDRPEFVREVSQLTGLPTYAARTGMEITLDAP